MGGPLNKWTHLFLWPLSALLQKCFEVHSFCCTYIFSDQPLMLWHFNIPRKLFLCILHFCDWNKWMCDSVMLLHTCTLLQILDGNFAIVAFLICNVCMDSCKNYFVSHLLFPFMHLLKHFLGFNTSYKIFSVTSPIFITSLANYCWASLELLLVSFHVEHYRVKTCQPQWWVVVVAQHTRHWWWALP